MEEKLNRTFQLRITDTLASKLRLLPRAVKMPLLEKLRAQLERDVTKCAARHAV